MAGSRLSDLVRSSGLRRIYEIVDIYDMWVSGRVRLRDPRPPKSWGEAIARLDYSLWLYSVFALSIAASTITLAGGPGPARVILAAMLVFFLPGYSLVKLAYPSGGLRPVEELTMSIASSIALSAFTGLVLNYTLGITLEATAVGLALESSMLAIAAHNRWWRLEHS